MSTQMDIILYKSLRLTKSHTVWRGKKNLQEGCIVISGTNPERFEQYWKRNENISNKETKVNWGLAFHLQVFLNRRRFPKLCRSRTIQIKAYHPHSRTIQNLTFLFLILRLNRGHMMQIKIRSDPETQKRLDIRNFQFNRKRNIPNSKSRIQPASILFPPSGRDSVDAHQNIRLT